MSSDYFDIKDARDALTCTLRRFTLWDRQQCLGPTVLEHLKVALPHINEQSWPERICLGGLYVNGKRIEADQALSFPCKIDYYEPKFRLEDAADYYPVISEKNIIYRGDGILAVFKPAGLPTMPSSDQRRFNLRAQLISLLGTSADIHFPSRIDTSVAGLVIISEDRKMHNKLQVLYSSRQIKKNYLALVHPAPDWEELVIDAPIGKSREWGVLRCIDHEAGKPSRTFARRLSTTELTHSQDNTALLRVFPLTGRTHQIRLHLSSSGCPIVGDRFYAGLKADKLHLLSHSASFKHPINRTDLEITLPQAFLPDWGIGLSSVSLNLL